MLENNDDWIKNIKTKKGVSLSKLKPEIRVGLRIIYQVYKSFGYELTVTSTNDGKHMFKSLHYKNQAFDSRIWFLNKFKVPAFIPKEKLLKIINVCKNTLGKDYDIILEKTHIHMEYDPK